jgi:hypothetical protein
MSTQSLGSENKSRKKQREADGRQARKEVHVSCFMLACWLLYSSILKMEAIRSSERSVDFQRTTRRYIQEDINLCNNRRENLKSYIILIFEVNT